MANEQLAGSVYCPKPVRGKVIINIIDSKRKSRKSGLVKAMAMSGQTAMGEVIATGDGVTMVKVGDFVHFDRVLMRPLHTADHVFHVIPEGAVMATEDPADVEFVAEGVELERVPALLVPGARGGVVQ